jgi:hypothetical protein
MNVIGNVFTSVDRDMKIYGVTHQAEKIQAQELAQLKGLRCPFIITPNGIVTKILALIIFITLMVTGITIPLSAAFDANIFALDLIVNIIFVIDLILGFFSGYSKKDGQCER